MGAASLILASLIARGDIERRDDPGIDDEASRRDDRPSDADRDRDGAA